MTIDLAKLVRDVTADNDIEVTSPPKGYGLNPYVEFGLSGRGILAVSENGRLLPAAYLSLRPATPLVIAFLRAILDAVEAQLTDPTQ